MEKIVIYIAIFFTTCSVAAHAGQTGHAFAQKIDEKQGRVMSQNDTRFQPRLGTYHYCFEFNNMGIGNASICLKQDGELYKMEVNARTNETIDYIYKIRYQGQNLTDPRKLIPIETRIWQKVKSTIKEMFIIFHDDGTIDTSEKKIKRGRTARDETRQVHMPVFTADPFSATYLARGFDWKKGAEHVFEVYTGKDRYELTLKCTERTEIEIQEEKRDVWVIVPAVKKLSCEGDHAEVEKKQPPDVKVYLSADEMKDVLKVEANHTLGTFLVFLERFEPLVEQGHEEIRSEPPSQAIDSSSISSEGVHSH